MKARTKYKVVRPSTYQGTDRELEVFADEVSTDPNGHLFFSQLIDVDVIAEGGVTKTVKDLALVLVLAPGTFESLTRVDDSGELFKQSGVIVTSH